jgi:hypothetical protein
MRTQRVPASENTAKTCSTPQKAGFGAAGWGFAGWTRSNLSGLCAAVANARKTDFMTIPRRGIVHGAMRISPDTYSGWGEREVNAVPMKHAGPRPLLFGWNAQNPQRESRMHFCWHSSALLLRAP